MANPREGPNPLRPYYIPPSIGFPPEAQHAGSSGRGAGQNGSTSYASSARDMFSDIDYSDYVSEGSQSTVDMIKQMLDEAMYKYMSVLIAQPFDVAKTILQVRSQALADTSVPSFSPMNGSKEASEYMESKYAEYPSDDSDPDEPAYFTSNAPSATSYTSPTRSRRHATDRAGYVLPSADGSPGPNQLTLKQSDSILEIIGQLWSKEGAWGVWKGSNSTFIYSVLLRTFENWARSFLCAVFNAPDPGIGSIIGVGLDMVDSPYPWSSLGIAVGAAAIAGLALAPLDIVRTKLILMSTNAPRRGLVNELGQLPSWVCPGKIFVPTVLHSIISPVIIHSTPLVLSSQFSIDQVRTPTVFSIASFLSQAVELFVKLPLETVLRRGQMSVLTSPPYYTGKEMDTVVDIGPYNGPIGTMWAIAREEGVRDDPNALKIPGPVTRTTRKQKVKQGQGVEGLWRAPPPANLHSKSFWIAKAQNDTQRQPQSNPTPTRQHLTTTTAAMHLMYTLDAEGTRVYTLKKINGGEVTKSAHPARFSPDDKYSRHRVTLKKRYGLLLTQQKDLKVLGQ
ncbi:hypothetical protein V496_06740 [Pseudogymnoascus sp. VKM F-4515 (FW-2607)]|nr:hypothetical protein V496_06740 [Pseudogymnoascus sp. VKM F-4515 (FW-2607)]